MSSAAAAFIRAKEVPPELLLPLAAVEELCFERPWGPAGLKEALEHAGTSLAYLQETATPSSLVAYCLYRRLFDELEILQLATHPAQRRKGLARQLLDRVLLEEAGSGCTSAFLEVRRSNQAALLLYEEAGFVRCGVRRGYYPAGTELEDALLLRRDLSISSPSR